MKTVQTDLKITEQASRVELFVRLVYWIPLAIVGVALSIGAGIIWILNIFSILILGKRFAMDIVKIYWKYNANVHAYYSLATDERPPILPEK